jgi:hypothetical protein
MRPAKKHNRVSPMLPDKPRASHSQILIEGLLLALIFSGVAYIVWFFSTKHYLPQPFVWDTQDTFMDFFNVAYWAHRDGIYSVWRAVYPPLSFALLRLVSDPSCYVSSSFAARECDYLGHLAIIAAYLGAIAVSYRALRLVRPEVAIWRALALAFGLPGLFVFERGNLLIVCQLCLAVVVVPGFGRTWTKALLAGVMINLKPYLLLPTLSLAIKGDWRQLELAGIASLAIYCASWAIIGAGNPIELLENTRNWVDFTGSDVVFEIYYTTSFNNMFGVIDRGFPILRFVGSRDFEIFRAVLESVLMAAQLSAVLAIVIGCLRPRGITQARFALLIFLWWLVGRSPGGYVEFLVVFLVFLEPWSSWPSRVAIIVAYLISIPYEFVISYLPPVNTASWLSGFAVTANFGIGVSQFVRPIGLLIILLVLSWDTIAQVTKSLRSDRQTLRVDKVGLA